MSEGSAHVESPASTAPVAQVKVDEEQQKRIQKYIRAVTLTTVLIMIITAFISVPAIALVVMPAAYSIVASPWLALQPEPGWYPLQILAVYLLGAIFIEIFLFVFSVFSGYILPRRYKLGVRTHSFSAWIKRWLRIQGRLLLAWLCALECGILCIAIQPVLW